MRRRLGSSMLSKRVSFVAIFKRIVILLQVQCSALGRARRPESRRGVAMQRPRTYELKSSFTGKRGRGGRHRHVSTMGTRYTATALAQSCLCVNRDHEEAQDRSQEPRELHIRQTHNWKMNNTQWKWRAVEEKHGVPLKKNMECRSTKPCEPGLHMESKYSTSTTYVYRTYVGYPKMISKFSNPRYDHHQSTLN